MDTPRPTRPGIKGYGISTKPEGMLDWEWVEERLLRSRNYWICSVRPTGIPHSAPVWGVWLNSRLYFGSAKTSVRAANLAKNPAVSMHLESGDEVVIVQGRASIVTDRKDLKAVAVSYAKKYPGYGDAIKSEPQDTEPCFAITPSEVLAWTEADFLNTPTRWKFD